MKEHTLTIPAGEFKDIHQPGTFVRFKSAGDELEVEIVDQGIKLNMSAGQKFRVNREFSDLKITNKTAAQVVVVVLVGRGDFDDTSVVGTVAANIVQSQALTSLAPVVVGTAATPLLGADSARKGIRFYNDGAADVYLGATALTVANSPVKIAPGDLWIESEAAASAWYGISATAGQTVKMQML